VNSPLLPRENISSGPRPNLSFEQAYFQTAVSTMSRPPPGGYGPLSGGGGPSGAGLFDRRQQQRPSVQPEQYSSARGYDQRGMDRRQPIYSPPPQQAYAPASQQQSNEHLPSGFFSKLTRLGGGGYDSQPRQGGVFRVAKVLMTFFQR